MSTARLCAPGADVRALIVPRAAAPLLAPAVAFHQLVCQMRRLQTAQRRWEKLALAVHLRANSLEPCAAAQ